MRIRRAKEPEVLCEDRRGVMICRIQKVQPAARSGSGINYDGTLIRNFLKIESLWVAGSAGGLDACEDIFDIIYRARPKPDVQESADDMARHVMKEIICMDQDLHLLSGAIDRKSVV